MFCIHHQRKEIDMNSISLPLAELKSALAGLGKVITRNSTLPVLGCVKIHRTAEGWVALTATDLERFVTRRVEQPCEPEALTVLAPYRELLEIVRSCGSGERLLIAPKDSGTVSVRFSLAGQFGEQPLKCPAADEFPPTPTVAGEPVPFSAPLRHAIHQAMECASEDPTRAMLQGALLDVSQPKAHHIVATDGKVLFSANSWQLPLKRSVFIPAHRFLAWPEFNRDGEWQLRVSPDAPLIQINSRRWRFISRVPEGQYPNWRHVLPDPQAAKTRITIDPRAVAGLVKTLDRLPCHDPEHLTMGLEWKQGALSVMGRPPGSPSWVKVPVPEANGSGSDVTVFLNRQLVIRALEFELTEIAIIDPMSPVRFSSGSRQMIVMPVRVDPGEQAPAPKAPARPINGHAAGPTVPTPAQKRAGKGPSPAAGEAADRTPLPAQRKPAAASRPRPRSSTPPRIDDALEQVGSLREAFRSGLAAIRSLTAQLRGIKSSHKATEKEVQTVRSQLRKIQNVKL